MQPKSIGPIAQTWYKWKSLRLPWRKRFFIGYDLQGNTYWEFRLTKPSPTTSPEDSRWRRIVNYPRSTHYSQVKVSPLWHQWLRYTRRDPPSLEEQTDDIARQNRMKYLAAEADARWEAKPRVMEDPDIKRAALPQQTAESAESPAQESATGTRTGTHAQTQNREGTAKEAEDPWAKAKASGPSENWQPTAWNPNPTKKS